MACLKKISGREGYWIDYHHGNKRVIRKSKFDTRRGAERELRHVLLELEMRPGLRRLKRRTFGQMCDEYLDNYAKVSLKSWESQVYILDYLKEFFGEDTFLSHITPQQIQKLKAVRKKEVSVATTNRHLALLRSILNFAVQWGYLRESPFNGIKLFKENNKRVRFLSDEERSTLIEKAKSRLRPILIVALNCGLRRGEIFDLTWADLDFENRLIRIGDPKNSDPRHVPMNETVYHTLRKHPRRIDSEYVFPGRYGKRLVDIKKVFAKALEDAEIKDFRFHDCRHDFCSRLVMAGVDLATVQQLAGHKSIQMTMRYSHLSPKHKAKAVAVLDQQSSEQAQQAATS